MAFKINSTTEKPEEKKQVEHTYITWMPIEKVIETEKQVSEGMVRFDLSMECSATFFEKTDGISINIWGFEFWCKVRKGSKGYFISFPSYQKKDGSYGDYVKCFDKGFRELIEKLIKHLYE